MHIYAVLIQWIKEVINLGNKFGGIHILGCLGHRIYNQTDMGLNFESVTYQLYDSQTNCLP